MANRFKQGKYQLIHPEKYIGDPEKIRYMSSWELTLHKFLDNNPNIKRWGSEVVHIPYLNPIDGKIHKYWVDYYVEYVNKFGEVTVELIEVKPKSQTKPPSKTSKHHVTESITWCVNQEKWKHAAAFAKTKGWKFRVVTEDQLFNGKK